MKPDAEMIADYACECGENPLWDERRKALYWTDIPRGVIFRYDPATGGHGAIFEGAVVGGFTFQENGELLLFMERGAVRLLQRDGKTVTVLPGVEGEEGTRFNDVIADPEGRVFCGTLGTGKHDSRLYRLETDRSITCVVEGVGLSNGLGFTPDGGGLYYTDSPNRVIYRFDYDRTGGVISNQKVFSRLDEESVPDGMTVDAEGCVWSAIWGGSCVIRYDPSGKEMQRYAIPAPFVTSVVFGGTGLEDLYVTTAGGKDRPEGQSWGALFRLQTGARGVPEFRSAICV